MSTQKKMYVSPKYEMVKFDSQILTGWLSNCWGVVGNNYDPDTNIFSDGNCRFTQQPNIYAILPEYYPDIP